MNVRPVPVLLIAALFLACMPGCAGTEEAAALKKNLSDAEIRIDRFEPAADSYVLKGRVVSATPVGGAEGMAEAGQEISLTPWFSGGRPDPGNPTHSRLMTLPGVPAGSTIKCRIALDPNGAWRILSVL